MADISPMCSIIVARAIGYYCNDGAYIKFHYSKVRKPQYSFIRNTRKSTPPIMIAAAYDIATPIRIGIFFAIPLPHILNTITVTSAMSAIGQLVAQLFIADGASISPMDMIIGPVTTGGKILQPSLLQNLYKCRKY